MTLISAQLSQTDRDDIANALTTIKQRLPFLVDLGADKRVALAKMTDKNRSFILRALEVATQNPDFLPRSFDIEEMRKDIQIFDDLNNLLLAMAQLQDMLEDTRIMAGSEAYTAALTVYQYAKTTGQATNGMAPVVDAMRQHFRRTRKAKEVEVTA
jgi:hypothetical protein